MQVRVLVARVGVTGWVAMHGEPLLCQDVSLEEDTFPWMIGFDRKWQLH